MTPIKILKQIIPYLEALDCQYCLIGGHAASLYRSRERFTKDVDFALVAQDVSESRKYAEKCIEDIGLKPVIGFIPRGRHESGRESVCMITSEPLPDQLTGIVDILLPELPWVVLAVRRAQHNKIDLGFALVPVITPEDLIISKCDALKDSPDRFQDLDDLKELFKETKELNLDYLREGLISLSISVPDQIKKYAPATVAALKSS